jgi:hypothetical protein
MKIESKKEFQNYIRSLEISSEYIVIKPNWVILDEGRYTDPETFSWLLDCFHPHQKIIAIESYTPWRGLSCEEIDVDKNIGVDLISGKAHWDFYKKQDVFFLKESGIGDILKRYNVKYMNITNEYWKENCCPASLIDNELEKKSLELIFKEISSYFPKELFDIREKATFISLTTIKLQKHIPSINISLSLKNQFGLIPNPCRLVPYHGANHESTPYAIADINKVYASIFRESIWINDGLKYVLHGYTSSNEKLVRGTGLFFVGQDPVQVDSETCKALDIDPKDIPYIQLLKGVWLK